MNPPGSLGENLVFVLSAPRSGSTLVQRILDGHPRLHAPQEAWVMLPPVHAWRPSGLTARYNADWALHALEDMATLFGRGRETRLDACRGWGLAFYRDALARSGKPVFIDKTPRYYHIIPDLAEIFPRAKFVVIRRNPLAVLHSILEGWVDGDWDRLHLFRDDLLECPRLLAEGIDLLGARAHVISYESLVANPDTVVRGLCAHLGEDFIPGMLDYGSRSAPDGRHGDKLRTHTFTSPQPSRAARWTALWRDPDTRALTLRYLHLLGDSLLVRLGYPGDTLRQESGTAPADSIAGATVWDALLRPPVARSHRERLAIAWWLARQENGPAVAALRLARSRPKDLLRTVLESLRAKPRVGADS